MPNEVMLGLAALGAVVCGVYLRFIRPWQLRWGATDEEVARAMSGDDVVKSPTFNATRAVTIQARPEEIFPWLVQMGVTRAGWYSYDWLDNLGRPSAERIVPELQYVAVGDVIPMSPDGKQGLRVKDFEANQWMLWWDNTGGTTWYWGLSPLEENQTRLITRVRTHYHWTSPMILFDLLVEFTDIIMMRKCMLGIKRRADRYLNPAEQQDTVSSNRTSQVSRHKGARSKPHRKTRRRRTTMTQTIPHTPSTGEQPEYREEFHVMGEQLVTTLEQLLHEGNGRRISIKHEGHTVLEIPLTIGVVGVLVTPMLAAVGAIDAAATNCTIEAVRTEPPEHRGKPPFAQGTSHPPYAALSNRSYSIAHSGMRLLQQGSIKTRMSTTMIDLLGASSSQESIAWTSRSPRPTSRFSCSAPSNVPWRGVPSRAGEMSIRDTRCGKPCSRNCASSSPYQISRGFRTRSFQSGASGAHALCDAYLRWVASTSIACNTFYAQHERELHHVQKDECRIGNPNSGCNDHRMALTSSLILALGRDR